MPALPLENHHPVPWFKQLWLWLLLTPPLISVVAGSYMASLAYHAQDPMVVDDYYKEGQAINRDLRRDKAAAALRLGASLQYDAAAGMVAGRLAGNDAVPAGTLIVKLVHPTQPEKDRTIRAQVDSAGNFAVPLPLLDRAQWQVSLEDQAGLWRISGTWNWPQQQGIKLSPL
ncbi:FixH family protein [Undibacterium sp. TJN25]|uniref:FixH family protein n=1 Tax=Undibacterium sp. TJN25 TaxID=3413056 RepID=UPI003BF24D7C